MAKRIKFTNTAVSKLIQGQYQDTQIPALHLSVSPKGVRSWYIYKSWQSAPFRYGLARYPDLSTDAARLRAQEILGKLAIGIDPKEDDKARKLQSAVDYGKQVTLFEMYETYVELKTLSDSSRVNYEKVMRVYLQSLNRTPVASITPELIRDCINPLTQSCRNMALALLKSIMRFTARTHPQAGITTNGIDVVSLDWGMRKELPLRKTRLASDDIHQWWESTALLPMEARAYLRSLLLCGSRKTALSELKWEHVDMTTAWMILPKEFTKSKNRIKAPDWSVPIPPLMMAELEMLQRFRPSDDYVFAEPDRKHKPIRPMNRWVSNVEPYCPYHGLRRTFRSMASTCGIQQVHIKTLLHHSTWSDVTDSYDVAEDSDLRKASNKINAFVQQRIETKKVVNISAYRGS